MTSNTDFRGLAFYPYIYPSSKNDPRNLINLGHRIMQRSQSEQAAMMQATMIAQTAISAARAEEGWTTEEEEGMAAAIKNKDDKSRCETWQARSKRKLDIAETNHHARLGPPHSQIIFFYDAQDFKTFVTGGGKSLVMSPFEVEGESSTSAADATVSSTPATRSSQHQSKKSRSTLAWVLKKLHLSSSRSK